MVKKILILLFVFSSILSHGQANRFAGFGSRNTCPVEALAFIDSAAITNQTEKDAICNIVKQLKDSSLWSKMFAVYPMVGRSASSCKWNLIDPRDLNTSYRLVFYGGLTFDSTGMTGNGVNGYADPSFTGLNFDSLMYGSYGIYLSKNLDELTCAMGMRVEISSNAISLTPRLSNTAYCSFTSNFIASTNTDSRGIYIATRTSRTSSKTFKNNSVLATHNTFINAGSGAYGYLKSLVLLARSDDYNYGLNKRGYFSNNTCGFAFFGAGLSDAESATMHTIINTFITTLGR